MAKIHSFLLALAFGLLQLCNLSADIIVGTDFEGTTENGTTLDDVTYFTNGVTVAPSFSSLTVNNSIQSAGNGDLFTTPAADGFFAVANNTGNGGEWSFTLDFTTGSDEIDLKSFEFDWMNFNGTGGGQNAIRNTEVTFDLTTGGASVFGGPIAQNTANINTNTGATPGGVPNGTAGTQSASISLTGTLAANTTYTLFVQAGDATTGGNNFGFDAIDIHGTISTVPEPGSLAVLGLLGLAATWRRRRG